MSALLYLFGTRIKNMLKDMKRHPSKLILILFYIALFVVVLVAGGRSHLEPGETYRPMAELYAMAFALYGAMYLMTAFHGISSGATFFTIADVNLVFPSPIRPRRILLYGLVRQLGTSLLVGFFLLFQYGWLSNTYGIAPGHLVAIVIGYAIATFCASISAMLIYTCTSGKPEAQKLVKRVLMAVAILVVVYCIYPAFTAQDKLGAIVAKANSLPVSIVPVVGWLRLFVAGWIGGEVTTLLLGLGLMILLIAGLIYALFHVQGDFYEDVLGATEVSYSAITAQKEGKLAEASPAHVKVGKTGIGRGYGPSAFFYKHLLENRRARLFVLDTTSLIFLATTLVFAFFLREAGIFPIFLFATYMQVFSSSMGRWLRELTQPYVYLIPEDPFKKLCAICGETVYKSVVEAIVLLIPVGVIVGASVPEVIICILCRITFGLLFIGCNILCERLFGSVVSKALILFLFFIIILVMAAPGVVLGILSNVYLPLLPEMLQLLLVMSICNVGIAALVAFLCRNILSFAELNNH